MKFHRLLCASPVLVFVASPASDRPVNTETCRLERSGKATGRSADICERLGLRWTQLVGSAPIPGHIRLVNRIGYGSTQSDDWWTLESPLPDTTLKRAAYRVRDGLLRYYADNIIPHEAGHSMFAVFSGPLRLGATSRQYGTQAPDWLDEAAAVWMESASMRANRVRHIQRTTPSLATLVTLEHPNTEVVTANVPSSDFRSSTRTVMPPCAKCAWIPDSLRTKYQITDSGVGPDGRQKTLVWYSNTPPAKSSTFEEREFYPLSYALLRFIRTRGGVAAVRELISRYRIDPKPRIEVFSALPGLPASTPAFERAWHAFLASMPAEDE